jgi:N-acetylglutamate synthase-like GNAT family acetyltransferase
MTVLTLVSAEPSDLEKINSLMVASKAHWGYDEAFMKKFREQDAHDAESFAGSILRLAYCGNELIGFFGFIGHENEIELDSFFIHPRYIGKGYGRKLWQHCLATMRELGYNSFFILTDPYATGFYSNMGCVEIAREPSTTAPGRFDSTYRYTARS